MSISYEKIEDSIVQRLKPFEAMPNFEVMAMPENQAEATKPLLNGRVTVMYDGSRYEPNGSGMTLMTMDVGLAVQQETVHIKTAIQSRKLRGPFGIYDLIRIVRNALAGFEPAGGDQLKQINTQFSRFEENTWEYVITWGTNVINVPDEPVTDDPLITSITLDQNFPIATAE
jgi:hypothetical protein